MLVVLKVKQRLDGTLECLVVKEVHNDRIFSFLFVYKLNLLGNYKLPSYSSCDSLSGT